MTVLTIGAKIISMSTIHLDVEEDLLALLQVANRPIQQTARELIILELYRQGKISSGKAGQLLDMPRWEFIPYSCRLGLPFFDMTAEEWDAEKKLAGGL